MPYTHPEEFVDDRGVLLCEPITPESLDRGLNLDLNQDDVIIASYPKSGTTWVKYIVYLVLHQNEIGVEVEAGRHMMTEAPYVEFKFPLDQVLSKPSPRLLTSHLPQGHLNHYIEDKKVKVIQVRRGIPDLLTSWYHFYQTNPFLGSFSGSFDDFFKLFESDSYMYGDPIVYNQQWWDVRDSPGVLCLTYEGMQKDVRDVIRQVGEFLGKPLREDTVERIAEETTLSRMRENPFTDPTAIYKSMKNFKGFSKEEFFRKGVVGDWKEHFTTEQIAYLEKRLSETTVPYE